MRGFSQLQETVVLQIMPHICILHLLKCFHIYYFIWVVVGVVSRAGCRGREEKGDRSFFHYMKRQV